MAQIPDDDGDSAEVVQQALRIAKKGRWWILLTALGSSLAAVIVLSFVPNVYRAESTILIVEQQIPQNLVAPLSNVTGAQKLQAMTQEVLSRSRLLKIIEEVGLYAAQKKLTPDAAIELIRKSIVITPAEVARDGSISAFTISFMASTPAMAQEVTRRLSSLFIERHSEKQVNRANSTTDFLKERLAEKRKRAADLEQKLREFKTQYATDLPENRLANESRLGEARMQLQNTISNLSRAKQQRIIWESMLSGNLNARMTRMKTERAALLARFTPKHPEVLKRDEEIAQLERLLVSIQAGATATEEQLSRLVAGDPAVSQLQGQLDANRLEVEGLLKDQKRFEGLIADGQRHLNMTPALEQQLTGMVRESEALNQDIMSLDKMDQQSGLSADMERRQQGEQFRQLDAPILPLRPLSPDRFKMSAGASVGGIVLGFVLAFVANMRKSSFQTEQQLREKFSPPLVLSVPELPTPQETRAKKRQTGFEWAAGGVVAVAMLAVEFYVYRNP